MIADFLPSAGSHAAERKGRMDDNYSRAQGDVKSKTASVKSKVQQATAQVKSAASSASASATPSPSPSPSAARAGKMDRAEMDKTRDRLKERIEEQGKKGYKQVKSEVN